MKLNLSREAKIGLIVAGAIFLLVYGLNFLKGKNIFTNRTHFFAIYENVDGLTEANPVFINGFIVGQVNHIFFHPDNSGKMIVEISLKENDLTIPKNTVARVFANGLLGTQAINLVLGDSKAFAESGDTLAGDVKSKMLDDIGDQVLPIKNKAEKLIVTIDSLVASVNGIINQGGGNNLKNTLKNLNSMTAQADGLLASEKVRLDNILQNVESITGNLKTGNKDLAAILKNFNTISDSLAKANIATTINNANSAIKNIDIIAAKINSGKGSIGLLVNNDSLYNNLTSASKNLDKLLIDLNQHPGRYVHLSVFGKKDSK
ncbi:MAG TPA: MlaD family protein [Bacteroidia bacterium]|nr:MlaD family protein [Bacteroidia bacterium]HRH07738.1 MlaD family protein [Bacteroidia bacterium]HRH61903.1 MlaD family protein [Bacteroidia bacterium]